MKHFILRTLVTALAIFVVVNILPWVKVDKPLTLILIAILLGILNTVLRPLLIFLTLPITILSFGLFIFVINGLILYLISKIVHGFDLPNLWVAILASILISIVSGFMNWLISDVSKQRNY